MIRTPGLPVLCICKTKMTRMTFFIFEVEALAKIVPWQPIDFNADFDEQEIAALEQSRYGLHIQNALVLHPSKVAPKSIRLTKYLGNLTPYQVLEDFFANIQFNLLVKVNK